MIPPAAEIVDGTVWTLAEHVAYENGTAIGLGGVAQLPYYQNQIFVQTTDSVWYQPASAGWSRLPGDPRAAVPSASNTAIPPVPWIVDGNGTVWTMTNGVSRANGKDAGLGDVALLLYYNNSMYAVLMNAAWYQLSLLGWAEIPGDPRG